MRVRRDHHAGAGQHGRTSACWRGAVVVGTAALSLAAGAVPAAAAGGYTVTATIPVGSRPLGVAVDPATHTVYVTNTWDGTVSVIDEATRAVTATIPVGTYPAGVAVDPAAGTVYVTNGTGVSVIDAATRAVTATIPVGTSPAGVAVDPSTHTVYVANEGGGTVSVIDAATRAVTATIPVGSYPYGVAVDPATHTAYVTNFGDGTVSVIDEATRAVTATIPVGSDPVGVSDPAGVAVDPATHTAYVTNSRYDTVSVIDEATSAVIATIPGFASPIGVSVDPSTHTVYVANGGGTVSVIDEATSAVTATIPVGSQPHGVAVDPATHTAYVANYGDGTVSVITHPVITTTSPLPPGTAGMPYTTTLHAAGGISPWTWAVTGGSLPAGLTLSPGGTITGTPAAPGTRTFTAQATDHDGNTAAKSLTLTIDGPDLAITLADPQPFRALHAGAYQVTVTNTGTAAEPRAMVHLDLARGLVPARAGGSGWTCRASLSLRTETCARTTPLAPGHATTFPVQTLVLARPGTVLTSTADVTPADATPADNHASDTTRVQR